MDRLTVGSLFAGIGGIDLGLERAGMEVRWHSEIDPYASRVLAKHWPTVPNLGDITKIDFRQVEPVDVLAGGFPCQDISRSGNKEGIGGTRSGLWSEYARAISELRPGYVFVENVSDLLARGFGVVLGDLAALGYDAEWDCIPAASVGAPHQRDRLWIVAYPAGSGLEGSRIPRRSAERGSSVSNAYAQRLQGRRLPEATRWRAGIYPAGGGTGGGGASLRHERQWASEPAVGRVAHGVPARVDRLRGIGNAVVPQIPELIGAWIIEHARATGYLKHPGVSNG